jgi:hypothetical protein
MYIGTHGHIIEIVSAVISLYTVRGIVIREFVRGGSGILILSVGHAVTSPIGEIFHGGRPDRVVLHAESVRARLVMAAI